MYEFAYCFVTGQRIEWIVETADGIFQHLESEDRSAVQHFIQRSRVGEFIALPSGGLVMRCQPTPVPSSPPPPKTLQQVFQESGLLDDDEDVQFPFLSGE